MAAEQMVISRWFKLGFEAGLAVLALVLGWILATPVLATFAWSWPDFGLGLLAVLPMEALFWFCLWCPLAPFQRLRAIVDDLIVPIFRSDTLLDLLLISLAAGIGEEMLFRGFLQAYLTDRLGLWPAVALASIVFGLCHAITPTYLVLGAGMGVYLGLVWVYTGNLLTVIVAHTVYDFIALVLLVRGPDEASRGCEPPEEEHLDED